MAAPRLAAPAAPPLPLPPPPLLLRRQYHRPNRPPTMAIRAALFSWPASAGLLCGEERERGNDEGTAGGFGKGAPALCVLSRLSLTPRLPPVFLSHRVSRLRRTAVAMVLCVGGVRAGLSVSTRACV